ncbi:MAG: zinc dependent phospholipase C family protein [Gemmatimonadetes bacterium]|nr:zinc dependent phospholipase C family protein [Gemmatimonadota bacterium]NNM34143.1 zinc dependent phospholipase C family protein [Gemmatimonadota bacterium]
MTFRVLAVAFGWLLLSPADLWAWGPGTHVALGEGLLAASHLIPPAVAELIRRFPIHFLYGSVAADISFAKKYVPEGRHCHAWPVGYEILAEAPSEPLRATGYGYLCHLAADTIAHNYFVPRKLVRTNTTKAIGHTYWEMRMDAHVGEQYVARARRIVMDYDHGAADALFDQVLSSTLFSFQTNRRIFRGMIRFHGNDHWNKAFDQVLKKSRFDLPDDLVHTYLSLSFDYVVDFLNQLESSQAAALDPTGEVHLRLAKKLRRVALAQGAPTPSEEASRTADEFFPLPSQIGGHWPDTETDRPMLRGGTAPD